MNFENDKVLPAAFSVNAFLTSLLKLGWIAIAVVTFYYGVLSGSLPDTSKYLAVIICLLGVIVSFVLLPKQFSPGFLITSLLLLINWRVAVMLNILPIIIVSAVVSAVYLITLFSCMRNNWLQQNEKLRLNPIEWQMTVVRIYFAYDMVGHFTEKLFAGTASFQHMTSVFNNYGVSNPGFMVILGGFCELGIAIGIGMGLFTRLAAAGGMLYFMVANHFGSHFEHGFTWSNKPNGGWEYPMLMAVFYFSFVLCGAGRFSLDHWIMKLNILPASLRLLCTPGSNRNPSPTKANG